MKKHIFIFIFVLVLLVFCGCKKETSNIKGIKRQNILVYNPFIYKFVSYNLKTHLPENNDSDEGEKNVLQFSFFTNSEYYTSGDCYKRHFEIIKLNNGAIESVFKLKNKETEAIFPLATDEENTFFFKTDYSKKGLPTSIIVKLINNSLIEFSNTKGYISNGAILNNLLYYTVFDEIKNTYSLYVLDFSNSSNKPKIVKTNLEASELYVLNNKLYLSNKDTIYNEDDVFKKSSVNYYDTKSNTLLQIDPNPNNSYQLSLKIIKADTKKVIRSIDNIIGFTIDDCELTAYCLRTIEKVKLIE